MVTTHQGMTKQSGSVFCYGNNSNLAEHLQCLETRLPCPMVMQTVRFSVSRSPYKNMPWLLLEEISVPLWQVQGRVKRSKILDKKKDEEKRGWHPSFFLLSFFFFIIADLTVQNSKILARCGLSDDVAGIWSGNAIVSRFFFQNLILKLWRCIPTQVSRLATTVFTSGRMSCWLPTLPSPESSEEHEVELRRSSLQAYSLAAFSPIATIFGERAADVLRILLGCFIDRFIKLWLVILFSKSSVTSRRRFIWLIVIY